jgi:hypothetical protein
VDNENICQSELEGSVYLKDLFPGELLEVETRHTSYVVENRGNGEVLISGHPQYCPQPVLVKLNGSVGTGRLLKRGFIGRGMSLEFRHPVFGVIYTSPVQAIRRLQTRPQPCEPSQVSAQ